MSRRTPTIPVLLSLALGACASAPGEHSASSAERSVPFNELGRSDAAITIIEFSDLQCPFCAQFALQTFPEFRRNYVDTGKVRYAARDLPLSFHPFALPAAVAVRCAGQQGKFWEYRAAVFAAQQRLSSQPYDALAAQLGLDVATFKACRADDQQAAAVRADGRLAQSHGITSTPSFVVGRLVDGEFRAETFSGAATYAQFAARVDALLAADR
jgi:protein-disulfide isomerase